MDGRAAITRAAFAVKNRGDFLEGGGANRVYASSDSTQIYTAGAGSGARRSGRSIGIGISLDLARLGGFDEAFSQGAEGLIWARQ